MMIFGINVNAIWTAITSKVSKATSPTAGHLATLTSDGSIADSGVATAAFDAAGAAAAVSTSLTTSLATKAPIHNPVFTGNVTGPGFYCGTSDVTAGLGIFSNDADSGIIQTHILNIGDIPGDYNQTMLTIDSIGGVFTFLGGDIICTTDGINPGGTISAGSFVGTPHTSTIINTGTLTLPSTTDTLVGRATTDTLTNKTLTTPKIASILVNSGANTLTLPLSTDTVVGRATTDTLTNKTLTSPIISSISNTGTITLPTSTDTLVGRATTDTLTNKTITSPTITSAIISAARRVDVSSALTDASTIATNATSNSFFTVTLGGNRTLGNPTGATDGQIIRWALKQDGTGSRTITLDSQFLAGPFTITLSTTAGKTDILAAMYNAAADKFFVIGFLTGY